MTVTERKRGRPRSSDEKLRARGAPEEYIRNRKLQNAPAKMAERQTRKWRALPAALLDKLIREIPGSHPFALADGYTFDAKRANQALAFFPEQLNHIEGAVAYRPFVLERWQRAVVANLFGWVRWSAKWQRWVRRYRECLLYVPRKNGKSPLVAGLGLYVLFEDAETGQQNYLAASTRDQ